MLMSSVGGVGGASPLRVVPIRILTAGSQSWWNLRWCRVVGRVVAPEAPVDDAVVRSEATNQSGLPFLRGNVRVALHEALVAPGIMTYQSIKGMQRRRGIVSFCSAREQEAARRETYRTCCRCCRSGGRPLLWGRGIRSGGGQGAFTASVDYFCCAN